MSTRAFSSALSLLNDEEKALLSEHGYRISQIISSRACTVIYNCEYFPFSENDDSIRLVCKSMEIVQAPRDFAKKFLPRELAVLKSIRAANIPHVSMVFSALQYKSKVMVFQRFAELGSLFEYICSQGSPLKSTFVKKWFHQMATAVSHLHSMNIVHRDIKCENILVTHDLNIKLSDFGFSRTCFKGNKQIYSSTFCGTMGYIAPEVLKGVPYIPQVTDVWSLGIVLFVMLNGSLPFPQDSVTKLHRAQMHREYKFHRAIEADLPGEVILLVHRMLEPRWFERINSKEILQSAWLSEFLAPTSADSLQAISTMSSSSKPMHKLLKRNTKSGKLNVLLEQEEDIDALPDDDEIRVLKRPSQ